MATSIIQMKETRTLLFGDSISEGLSETLRDNISNYRRLYFDFNVVKSDPSQTAFSFRSEIIVSVLNNGNMQMFHGKSSSTREVSVGLYISGTDMYVNNIEKGSDFSSRVIWLNIFGVK